LRLKCHPRECCSQNENFEIQLNNQELKQKLQICEEARREAEKEKAEYFKALKDEQEAKEVQLKAEIESLKAEKEFKEAQAKAEAEKVIAVQPTSREGKKIFIFHFLTEFRHRSMDGRSTLCFYPNFIGDR